MKYISNRFTYDPESGLLTLNSSGDVTGTLFDCGYLYTNIGGGKLDRVHRIAWGMVNGEIPEGMEIDHENQIRTDNRIFNLRLVSRKENMKNKSIYKNNSTGVSGVVWEPKKSLFRARIQVDGKRISLGRYKTLDLAIKAQEAGRAKYGFHQNHGNSK